MCFCKASIYRILGDEGNLKISGRCWSLVNYMSLVEKPNNGEDSGIAGVIWQVRVSYHT